MDGWKMKFPSKMVPCQGKCSISRGGGVDLGISNSAPSQNLDAKPGLDELWKDDIADMGGAQ